jgi:hypothetical protein
MRKVKLMSSENLISGIFRRVYWQIATDAAEALRSSEVSVISAGRQILTTREI